VPEDRKRAQASKQKMTPTPASPSSGPAEETAGNEPLNGEGSGAVIDVLPLGDIAREYRAMKLQMLNSDSKAGARDEQAGPAILSAGAGSAGSERKQVSRSAGGVERGMRRTHRVLQARSPKLASPPRAFQLVPSVPAVADPVVRPMVKMAPVEPEGVRVKAGDTLWKIAAEYLGRGEKWPELARVNPQFGDPTRLQIGTPVRLPGEASAATSGSSIDEITGSVRVEPGDSLWKVAQARLGDGAAWTCVAQANPEIQNSSLIFPGQILSVPASCAVSLPRVGRQVAASSARLWSRTAAATSEAHQ